MIRFSAAAALAVLATVIAPAANTADGDPQRHAASSPKNTVAAKMVVVRCPDGTVVLGAGGIASPAADAVILTGIVPSADLAAVAVTAVALPTQVTPWALAAIAVCQPAGDRAPRLVAGAAATPGTATARCATDEIAYGVGFRLLGTPGAQLLDSVTPAADQSTVEVHARGESSNVRPYDVIAYAVCGQPRWRHERTSLPSAYDPLSPKSGTAPKAQMSADGGSWVYAAGAKVTGPGDLHINGLLPVLGLDGAYAQAARLPQAALRADGDGWDLEVFGDTIGSWY
jgi:hypothetical protein